MLKSGKIAGLVLALSTAFGAVSLPTSAIAEEVYFFRGAFNVFSRGMDQMVAQLRARGVNARSYSNGQWAGLARDIVARNKQGKVSYPIIIAGHSVGGQEAPRFADALARAGVPVALVVGVDPGFAPPPPFTAGSPRVVNFWIAGSARGNPYRSSGSFSGSIQNVNIRSFGSTVDHVGIDKDPKVQARIVGLVMSSL
jgi:hypothetical protein